MSGNSTIFALTRHFYQSYSDLLKLIELSGFATCFIDEIDAQSNNTYILPVRNGEVGDGWQSPRAQIIHWQLEWAAYPPLPGIARLWSSDRWHAGQIGGEYVPMGSHPDLCPEMTPKQDLYDVAYIGYFAGVPRRQVIRQRLIEYGVKVSPTGAWGDERHALLRNSAAFLHVHQLANAPTIAPLRMIVAAAYGLPVITETVADAGIFAGMTQQVEYGVLSDRVLGILDDWERTLMPLGMALHDLLCVERTFRRSVESAV